MTAIFDCSISEVFTMTNTPDYILSRHVPDMKRGFIIQTNYGDCHIDADEAAPFIELLKQTMRARLRDERLYAAARVVAGWIR
jgi:hypothetical protein